MLQENLPRLRWFIRHTAGPFVRARETVSDIAQSVCREVLRRAGGVHPSGERGFRRWLLTMARRKIYDRNRYHRAMKRDGAREWIPMQGSTSLPGGGPGYSVFADHRTPSRVAMAHETLERFERAFGSLPARYQEVVRLSRFEGRSHGEIAGMLGCSLDVVYQRLSRALARLESLMSEGSRGAWEAQGSKPSKEAS